jgi:hypothetical protein
MGSNYPTALDTYSARTDDVDDVMAADVNDLQDAVAALETKVGADSSAVVTSVDYLLTNAAAVDPGHHHTNAALDDVSFSKVTYASLTAGHALFASSATAAGFRAIQESDIADGGLLARLAAAEVVAGIWKFRAGLVVGDTSALTASVTLEVAGTTGAFLLPRLTTTQKNALTPVNGMMLYDVTLNKAQLYESGAWMNLVEIGI